MKNLFVVGSLHLDVVVKSPRIPKKDETIIGSAVKYVFGGKGGLFTQKRIKSRMAMTGEITLRGKVLPVGGIKEKILAAKRAKIKEIILCKQNEPDVNEINKKYIKGLKFHYVSEMSEVIRLALTNQKVKNHKNL